MKKILIIITIFVFSNCSKEEDCYCNGKYKLFTYPTQYYWKKTRIDCQTRQTLETQTNAYFVGCD